MPHDASRERPEKILILGGTREAAELAVALAEAGRDVTTSLAGRTKEPAPVAGKVRIGGFGGIEGLAAHLRAERYTKVIDATHPFAKTISANAVAACKQAGVALEVRTRRPWSRQPGDLWIEVADLDAAAAALPAGACVLLALGRQHIGAFLSRTDCHFVIRMVDPPETPLGFVRCTIVTGKPSLRPEDEVELLRKHRITHIVCRNSGGEGAYAKIVAARLLSLPVVMVAQRG